MSWETTPRDGGGAPWCGLKRCNIYNAGGWDRGKPHMSRRLLERADYLLSKEKGTVFKDPGGKINIALVYPNRYAVGMSSLGFQGIYGLLNGFADVVCERVFLPDAEDITEHERSRTELFSLESKRTLARFDIVAFSVSFENDYPNIVKMLRMSRIPLYSSQRNSSYPVLIMGGACAFFNPEPTADFFDVCFIGEAEEMLPEFLHAYRESTSREELFDRSLRIEGVYIPRYYEIGYSTGSGLISGRRALRGAPEVIRKRSVSDIAESLFRPAITTPEAEFSDMYLLEAMRGCPWSCRFCVAGRVYKPVRKKDLGVLQSEIAEARARTNRVGLIGPSLSDYPYAKEVLKMEGVDFSITSLRASPRSADIAALMRGHKSISIAPEAGTERLRRVINKKVTEEDILTTAEMILSGNIETLRLYFMVGLPTETRDDIEGISDLVRKVRASTRRGQITLSVSTFVPKPFTPFQWHPMERPGEVKERLKMIKKALVSLRGVRVFHDVPKYAYMQGIFSLGDRRVAALAEHAASNAFSLSGGFGGLSADSFIFRIRDGTEILPWDFIDAGVPKEMLRREYEEALNI
jgi:radical SAM superfamily enzyme YgiQ (UPF0313 family)